MIGILFVDRDGNTYDPGSDAAHAAFILRKDGPAVAARLDEMHKAIGGLGHWRRRRSSGYACHAITCRDGHTAIVIGEATGWYWQVYRDGRHGPLRDIRDTPALTADEAMRLADEFIDRRVAKG